MHTCTRTWVHARIGSNTCIYGNAVAGTGSLYNGHAARIASCLQTHYKLNLESPRARKYANSPRKKTAHNIACMCATEHAMPEKKDRTPGTLAATYRKVSIRSRIVPPLPGLTFSNLPWLCLQALMCAIRVFPRKPTVAPKSQAKMKMRLKVG